jgi:dTDP-4-amino-4,6-dideoxygalactose transaminase
MIYMAKPLLGDEEKEAVCKVIDSGMIANGAAVTEFEQKFTEYTGTKHGVATTSGTTAPEQKCCAHMGFKTDCPDCGAG